MTRQQSPSDLYAVLGVTRTAPKAHIDHAFRALVRRYHPDRRALTDPAQAVADATTLRQVLAAYAVLGTPARRADYDQHDQHDQHHQHHQHHPTPEPATGPQPIRVHTHWTVDQPPLRAGPVYWEPSPR